VKRALALISIFCSLNLAAQQHSGFATSDFSGILSARSNPAFIANSPYKYDLNIINGSVYLGNNIGYLSRNAEGERGFARFDDDATRFIEGDLSVGGLSFLLALQNKASVGFQYQFRAVASGFDISPDFINQFGRLQNPEFSGSAAVGQSGNLSTTGWHELSFTYAGLLVEELHYRIKLGGTLKLVNPVGNVITRLENLSYTSDSVGFVDLLDIRGQVGYSSNLNEFEQFDGTNPIRFPSGLGYRPAADIGMVYETSLFRDDPQTKIGTSYYAHVRYEQRLAVSITDIGSMRFDYGSASFNVLNALPNQGNIDFDTLFSEVSSIRQIRDSLATVTNLVDLTGDYTVSMPTRLNINYDYNFRNNWYLNVDARFDISTIMGTDYRLRYPNSITVTPRYETGRAGAYFPVYMNLDGDVQVGTGVRIGPLTLGTQSINGLFSGKPNAGGFFFSLNINQLKLNSTKPYCFGKGRTGTAGTRQLRKPLYKRKKFLFW
jgi:opacity protein-like surface antigen